MIVWSHAGLDDWLSSFCALRSNSHEYNVINYNISAQANNQDQLQPRALDTPELDIQVVYHRRFN